MSDQDRIAALEERVGQLVQEVGALRQDLGRVASTAQQASDSVRAEAMSRTGARS